MKPKKRFTAIIAATCLLTVAGVSVAIVQQQDSVGTSLESSPPEALQRSLSVLDDPHQPSSTAPPSGGVEITTPAGIVRAWGYGTNSGAPAVAVTIGQLRVVGGCEQTFALLAKCLSQFQGSSLLVVGRATDAVEQVVVTTADGKTVAGRVAHGVWAVSVPTGGVVAPATIVGLARDGSQVGEDDGRRIVRSLEEDALGSRTPPTPEGTG